MTAKGDVDQLRGALIERARKQAEEIRAHARETAERIVEDKNGELRQRESRENQYAKSLGARAYRQHLESSRLEAKSELEQLRWDLAQSVLQRARQRLEELANSDDRYRPFFTRLLKQSAQSMGMNTLVVEVNERDLERLKPDWQTLVQEVPPGKDITLSNEPYACSGGFRLHDPDDRIRVDNTLEARLDRFHMDVMRVLMKHLFGDIEPMEELRHG